MGKGGVPDLPHIVVVPNSLVDQWHGELRAFFRPKMIEIIRVPTGAKQLTKFWRKNGDFDKAQHRAIFRVVLCPSSVSCHHPRLLTMC